jgi:hypothetical protein
MKSPFLRKEEPVAGATKALQKGCVGAAGPREKFQGGEKQARPPRGVAALGGFARMANDDEVRPDGKSRQYLARAGACMECAAGAAAPAVGRSA